MLKSTLAIPGASAEIILTERAEFICRVPCSCALMSPHLLVGKNMAIIIRFPRHARASTALKPNTEGSASSLPADFSAAWMTKKLSCDIRPRALQLLTAEVPTPAIAAVFPGPPSASITSSTVLIMLLHSSRNVKMSSLHATAVESRRIVVFNNGMAESLKSLAERLKMTREALGLSAAELCRRIDCKENRWSQYEGGTRKITLEVANDLCDEFGLTLDWIYRDNPAQLPHALRIKMRKAA
jgi:DNA-binding XRE family transcriptional regulator